MLKVAKITISLLLLGVLIASTYAQEEPALASEEQDFVNEEQETKYTCTHGQEDDSNIEYVDVEEEGLKEAQEGRVLAGTNYPQFRIYGYYGFLSGASSSYKSYISEKLLPPIISYWENALRVKYPVSGALKVTSSSICGHATPSVLRNGVNADFVYVFSSVAGTGTWVASTSGCQSASGSRRPLVGGTVINTNLFRNAGSNVLAHERNMLAIMHELTHALGFGTAYYSNFIDSNGKRLTGHLLSGTLDGKSAKILNVAPLTSMVRQHFNCPSAKGATLENQGSYGAVAGVHFERRQYAFEMMNAYLISEMKVTKFTLALLEGSGWYSPDYSYADSYMWGYQQGCDFLTGSVSSLPNKYKEFCSSSARKCSIAGKSGGSCSSDTVSDGAKFIHPSDSYNCGNTGAASYARLPSLQTFGRGTGSKCFEGTLGGSSATTFCFKAHCDGNILNIQVGGKTVACTAAGNKSVAGYSGSIVCPDPKKYCATIGQATCPRNCMGRGKCVNGLCQCYSGFKGEDCAL